MDGLRGLLQRSLQLAIDYIIKLALRDELMCLVSDIVEHLQIALNQCPMLKYRTKLIKVALATL